MGVTRDEFYDPANFAIAPMGFCFPGQDAKGGDLPPRRECAPTWRQKLLDTMPQIEIVLAIGLHAQKWHLERASAPSLTGNVQNWRAHYTRNTFPRILPLPHPSWRNTGWLKRHPFFEAEVLPVLRREIRLFLKGDS